MKPATTPLLRYTGVVRRLTLFAWVALIGAAITVLGLRHRVLVRLALRNLTRRRGRVKVLSQALEPTPMRAHHVPHLLTMQRVHLNLTFWFSPFGLRFDGSR